VAAWVLPEALIIYNADVRSTGVETLLRRESLINELNARKI
jgi:hypothetical protein